MAKGPIDNPPVIAEKLPVQINEINEKLNLIENLIASLSPGVDVISKEIQPTTLLIKKILDNIPTFVSLLDVTVSMKGMIDDFAPALQKISKEINPSVRDLRERFERDETLTLLNKVGENIPTFITLLDMMEAVKGMAEDFAPAVQKISKEVMPTITMLRESFERDETLELLQKTGENINTFNKLLDFLNKFDKSGVLDFTLEKMAAKETNVMIRGIQTTASKTMLQFMENPPKPGLKNIFSAVRDPEVQKGILFLTAFAKNLSQCMTEACMFETSK